MTGLYIEKMYNGPTKDICNFFEGSLRSEIIVFVGK